MKIRLDLSNPNDYFLEKTVKNETVIHATAGTTWLGADLTLDKSDKINVTFGMSEKAEIFQRIPIENWAYHTGTGQADKYRIGVEVTCPLLAYRAADGWHGYLGINQTTKQPILTKAIYPDSMILKLPFRGWKYFIALTADQIKALNWLLLEHLPTLKPWVKANMTYTTHAPLKSNRYDYPPGYFAALGLSYIK